jgi:Uma2 family endonuclease
MTQALPQPTTTELVPAQITLDQYHRMVDAGVWDERHVELLNGVVVEMAPEGIPHASQRTKAQNYLIKQLGEQAIVRVSAPITLPNGSEPEPDIAIVQPGEDEYDSHHPYPENIVWLMEFSQTSLDKDLGIKADIYAAEGIPEYWVVNLRKNSLIVFRNPVSGNYQACQELTSGTISPVRFPELILDVAKFLL